MVFVALAMLGVSIVGGIILGVSRTVLENRKRQKYLRWRSQWRLVKGGVDGYGE